MHQPGIFRFTNGKWVKATMPAWFAQATKSDEGWTQSFRSQGVKLVEDFDCGDHIEIFEVPDGSYCTIFRDVHKAIAVVFIKEVSDYLQFRAQCIAPNVQLMLASEQLDKLHNASAYRRVS